MSPSAIRYIVIAVYLKTKIFEFIFMHNKTQKLIKFNSLVYFFVFIFFCIYKNYFKNLIFFLNLVPNINVSKHAEQHLTLFHVFKKIKYIKLSKISNNLAYFKQKKYVLVFSLKPCFFFKIKHQTLSLLIQLN